MKPKMHIHVLLAKYIYTLHAKKMVETDLQSKK